MATINIYGIRHHGPGSARSLLDALARQQPDLILIEMPADAQSAIKHVSHEMMSPPVALLVYDPDDLKRAAFYPFAEFSPEWQAMLFGHREKIEIRFMDLPRSLSNGLREEAVLKGVFESKTIRNDPFAFLAEASGFQDHERWWEATLEHASVGGEIFESIQNLMRAMRSEMPREESEETLAREAHMRQTIRKGIADGFSKIAIVCGAWHGPVLEDFSTFKASEDAALLKKLKKSKTTATWIPWTLERLSTRSGYAAGIQSPAWYQLLFEKREAASVRWLAKAAELFRSKDLDASPADLVDSVRLAETVSVLRNLQIAGIDELRDAALAVFGAGHEKWMQLIDNQLITGEKMGQVPPDIAVVPLQKDFDEQVKSLRLSRYLKSAVEASTLKLDLREPPDAQKSFFLHRLNLLGIEWGREQAATGREQTTKNEVWKMAWQPEFSLRLIEVGIFGNTVAEAVSNFCISKLNAPEQTGLRNLIDLLGSAMKAELPLIVPKILEAVNDQAALTADVFLLADAILPLVKTLRYGQARQIDASQIDLILENLIPRVCVGLAAAVSNIDESAASESLKILMRSNRGIRLHSKMLFIENWDSTLQQNASNPSVAPLIRGYSLRALLDTSKISTRLASDHLRFEVTRNPSKHSVSLWIEGFLTGSGILLVHQPELFSIIDEWVGAQGEADFRETLPLLRRSFSGFTPSERQKLLGFSKTEKSVGSAKKDAERLVLIESENARAVLPLLRRVLN